ncbi:MAG: signal peptidase II [Firmicutes bacterium]|nr:signal peptidase II [Bacillota bacterium]
MKAVFYLFVFLVLLADQLTKLLVVRSMTLEQSIPVIESVFHLTYVHNPGGAFGILAYHTWFFVVVTLVVAVMILFLLRQFQPMSYWLTLALALQLGGALGNLVDRIRQSYVIDFLDFRFWPVFNLADTSIVVGIFLLLWQLVRMPQEKGA